jgi:hypothetical protein
MVKGEIKTDTQKTCVGEIGVCAQIHLTILHTIVNIIEGELCDRLIRKPPL